MTLPRKPESIKELEEEVKKPIIVEGYTIETVTSERMDIISKLKRLHVERVNQLATLAMWRRPKRKGMSLRKERDVRRR